jgi:hypothetical protein
MLASKTTIKPAPEELASKNTELALEELINNL